MTIRPALTTTTSIRDAAKIMTTSHFRHLPVAGDAGLLGVIDITDVCRALNNAGEGCPEPGRRSGPGTPSPAATRQTSARSMTGI